MPAFSASAGTKPVVTASSSVPPGGTKVPFVMTFTVSMGSKPASSTAPTTMPMNSELYVSLVMSASTIATIGGTSAQNVLTNSIPYPLLRAARPWLDRKKGPPPMTMTALRLCDSAQDVLLSPRRRVGGNRSAPSAASPFSPAFPDAEASLLMEAAPLPLFQWNHFSDFMKKGEAPRGKAPRETRERTV